MDESDFVLCLSMDFGIRGVDPSDSTTRMALVIYPQIRDNYNSACNALFTVLIEM